jgi:DNA invertase Pin-like site-specific DNA recombinase
MSNPKRAALYLRVSTSEQTTENQIRDLRATADLKGWEVVVEYEDAGISGAKGRDERPGLDAMLKAASLQRKKFDVVMAWSVDRLGRSLKDLVNGLAELHDGKVDLYLHKQQVDTTTAGGRALFQMMGVFAEFERAMITDRIQAGVARVKATGVTKSGKPTGRPRVEPATVQAIRDQLAQGVGMLTIGRRLRVGTSVVQRVAREARRVTLG